MLLTVEVDSAKNAFLKQKIGSLQTALDDNRHCILCGIAFVT
jgi:hypothetical protein